MRQTNEPVLAVNIFLFDQPPRVRAWKVDGALFLAVQPGEPIAALLCEAGVLAALRGSLDIAIFPGGNQRLASPMFAP